MDKEQALDICPSSPPIEPARLSSVAFLSSFPPERCGLATFASDLIDAVQENAPGMSCRRVATVDAGRMQRRDSVFAIPRQDAAAYRKAGLALNAAGVDLLCIQHEYGIFGGPDGEMLLELLDAADAPAIVTLHTVLDRPSANQRRVMAAVLERAAGVVVMTQRSARMITAVHGLLPGHVQVIPHGVPSAPVLDRAACRRAFGVEGRPALLTFGLLSPGKGIEHAIRALPALTRRWPGLLYTVVGATHPNLLRHDGEAYRDSLATLARDLGVTGNLRFVNRFVDTPELLEALTAADIYVTPYVNEAQSVSGTLSYSYGLGTPVVSTPYRHAAELLAEGRGVLVPFADPGALSKAIGDLLSDPARMAAMRAAAIGDGHRMRWPNVGADYVRAFEAAVARPVLADA